MAKQAKYRKSMESRKGRVGRNMYAIPKMSKQLLHFSQLLLATASLSLSSCHRNLDYQRPVFDLPPAPGNAELLHLEQGIATKAAEMERLVTGAGLEDAAVDNPKTDSSALSSNIDQEPAAVDLTLDSQGKSVFAAADLWEKDWWQRFGDEKLNRLIARGLEYNHDLGIAKRNLEAAGALRDVARTGLLPSIDIAGLLARGTAQGNPGQIADVSSGEALLNYQVDLWGKLSAADQAAQARMMQQSEVRNAVELTVTSLIAEKYFQLRAATETWFEQQRYIAAQRRIRHLVAAHVELGNADPAELNRSEQNLQAAEQLLHNLSDQCQSIRSQLAVMLGASPREIAALAPEKAISTNEEEASVGVGEETGEGEEVRAISKGASAADTDGAAVVPIVSLITPAGILGDQCFSSDEGSGGNGDSSKKPGGSTEESESGEQQQRNSDNELQTIEQSSVADPEQGDGAGDGGNSSEVAAISHCVERQVLALLATTGVYKDKADKAGRSGGTDLDATLDHEVEKLLTTLQPQNLAAAANIPTLPAIIPSDLLEQRPDIKAAEFALIAAHADVARAKAEFFPSINLSTGIGSINEQLASAFSNMQRQWGLSATLAGNVFNFGRNRALLRGAQAEKEKKLLEYQKTVIIAFAELANALSQHNSALESLANAQKSYEAQLANTMIELLSYKVGRTRQQVFLQELQRLLLSKAQLSESRSKANLAFVAVLKAIGGSGGGSSSNNNNGDSDTAAEAKQPDAK